jgi:hypothetical protein
VAVRHASRVTSSPIASAYRAGSTTAFGAAVSGMQTAEARADGDASQIATNGPDVPAIVDLDVQEATQRALASVIRTADEMTRTTVDLLA